MAQHGDDNWKVKAEAQVDALQNNLSAVASGHAAWQRRMEQKLDTLTQLVAEFTAGSPPTVSPGLSLPARNKGIFTNANASNWSLKDRHSPSTAGAAPGPMIEMGQGRFAAGVPLSPSSKSMPTGLPLSTPTFIPQLEESLFSAAKVKPKIDETIANVVSTMANLDLSGTSIEPAPNEITTLLDFLKEIASSVEKDLTDGG